MNSRQMKILFNIVIILALLIGLISIMFFGDTVLWVTGSTEALVTGITAYVGLFVAVVYLADKALIEVVKIILRKKFKP